MPTLAILAPSSVPFQIGGAEKLWWGLHRALSVHSDSFVELIKIPCREDSFRHIVESYRTFAALDLSHFDLLISTKYPAWMTRHPNHVVYVQHTLRGLYDTYGFTGLPETLSDAPAPLRELLACLRIPAPTRADLATAFDLLDRAQDCKGLPSGLFDFPGPLIREAVHFFDRVALAPDQMTAYAAISHNVRRRRDYFPAGVPVTVIHHPSDILDFHCAPGRYFFTASRLVGTKRLDLVVRAMRHVRADIPLKIAGTGPELPRLQGLAGDDARIQFLGHVPDAALPDLYAQALAVPFVPYDEDYGLITIEAMRSGKPVITVADAGGVCEFVRHGETGYCVPPTPEALGAAMQRLAEDGETARAMGETARALTASITWEGTATALLDCAAGRRQKKILVVSTFPASGAVAGGRKRLLHCCRELGRDAQVILICYNDRDQWSVEYAEPAPHVREVRLPRSAAMQRLAVELEQRHGVSAEDLAALRTCAAHQQLAQTLRRYGAEAAAVVCAHPYLYPAVATALPDTPLIYDAHNVEYDLKAALLGPEAEELAETVRAVEGQCCARARRVLVCAPQDAQRFAALYGLPTERTILVPNGYDAAAVTFTPDVQRRALKEELGADRTPLALFMGSRHQPNMEAVEAIKKMAAAAPDIHFLILGTVCEVPGLAAAPPNVHFVGALEESVKNVLLAAADFGLNPMASGAGTNLKVVEYLAAGLEVLSTPFGLRGMEPVAGVHSVPLEDFAAVLREAVTHPLPEAVREAAARRMTEQLSWGGIFLPVRRLLRDL